MKKFILSILVLCAVSSCFARVMLQLDLNPFGIADEFSYSCFNEAEPVLNSVEPILGVDSIDVIWEFNSDEIKPFHFYTGVKAGLLSISFTAGLIGGFNYLLAEKNNFNVELNTSFSLEESIYVGPIFNAAVDAMFTRKDRRGFYGGVGLFNTYIADVSYWKDYGPEFFVIGALGIHFVGGYKF